MSSYHEREICINLRSWEVGNGNPLQYSCLGNHIHRGAWWAIVHGIMKSWAQLSDWAQNLRTSAGNWMWQHQWQNTENGSKINTEWRIGSNFCAIDSFFNTYFISVAQLCLTLCDPMDCSMAGFPVYHQLLELAQTHIHWVSDVIQPSHPLSSPSPPAFNPYQHQGLFKWVSSSC